uniref:VWFA domain-containing protein n=1 Tax=Erpetoichthys calabaricus TaxID=27687 RepID=A0A8C4TDY0_ERPCA
MLHLCCLLPTSLAPCQIIIIIITFCPVSLQFVIDTSESIALHYLPPGGLVKQGAIDITWEMGGLHFSDRVEHFSSVTSNQKEFIDRLLKIQYIGKGTFTDCALANMTAAMATQASKNTRVRFAVVITDGHVTGSPCGGIKVTAERARDAGIKLFAVAPTTSTYESGLKEIANNPSELFRNNYQAVLTSISKAAFEILTQLTTPWPYT